ncbi:hypothetical protein, partial [Shewanella indica]
MFIKLSLMRQTNAQSLLEAGHRQTPLWFSYHSALKFSHFRPVSGAHLYHSLCTADEVVPSLTASIHNVLISFETA